MSNKVGVMYHSADLDGILSGVIADHYLSERGHEVTLLPADHGNMPIYDPAHFDDIYVIDFSDEELFTGPHRNKVIWIDHHISAIEKHKHDIQKFQGHYCIDGVAACRLAFQYFTNLDYIFVQKHEYFDRKVIEPAMVTLAGEHDIWDKTSRYASQFNMGIQPLNWKEVQKLFHQTFDYRLTEFPKDNWPWSFEGAEQLNIVLGKGEAVMAHIGNTASFTGKLMRTIHGVTFAIFNTHIRSSLVNPDMSTGEEATMVFSLDAETMLFRVSMYTEKGNADMSAIAKIYGGGGHRGAAGFKIDPAQFIAMLTDPEFYCQH